MKKIKLNKMLYISAFLFAVPLAGFCSSPDQEEQAAQLSKPYVIYDANNKPIHLTKQEYKEVKENRRKKFLHSLSTEGLQETYDQRIEILQDYFSQNKNFNFVNDFTTEQLNAFYKSHRPTDELTKINTYGYWQIVLGKYITEDIIDPITKPVNNIPFQIAPEAKPDLIYNLIRFLDRLDKVNDDSTLENISNLIGCSIITPQIFFEMLSKCSEKDFEDYNKIIAEYATTYKNKAKPESKKYSGSIWAPILRK